MALEIPVAAYAVEQPNEVGETVSDNSIDTSEMVSGNSINVSDTTDNQPEEDDNGEESDGLFGKMKESVQTLSEVLMGDGDRALNELHESNFANSLSDNGWSVSRNILPISANCMRYVSVSENRLYSFVPAYEDYYVFSKDTVSANGVTLKFYKDESKENLADKVDFLGAGDVCVVSEDVYMEPISDDGNTGFWLDIKAAEALEPMKSADDGGYTVFVSGNSISSNAVKNNKITIVPKVIGDNVEIRVSIEGTVKDYGVYPYYPEGKNHYKCAVESETGLADGDSCTIPGLTETDNIYYIVRQIRGQYRPLVALLMNKGADYIPAKRLLLSAGNNSVSANQFSISANRFSISTNKPELFTEQYLN